MEPKNGTTREVSPKMMAMAAMTCAAALVTSCPTAFSCFQDSFNTGQTEKQQRGSRLPVLLEHTAAQGQRGNDHHQQAKDYATNGATKQSRFEGRLGCPECWQDRLRTLTFRTTATKPKRSNRRVTWSNTLPSQAMACITPAESTRRPRERAIFGSSAAGRCHSKLHQRLTVQGMLAMPGLVTNGSRKLQWIPFALEPPLARLSSEGSVAKGYCMHTNRSRKHHLASFTTRVLRSSCVLAAIILMPR